MSSKRSYLLSEELFNRIVESFTDQGGRLLPSVIAVDADKQLIVTDTGALDVPLLASKRRDECVETIERKLALLDSVPDSPYVRGLRAGFNEALLRVRAAR